MKRIVLFSMFAVISISAAIIHGEDCPRFRGAACDGMFSETRLLKKWPENGPKLAWSAKGLGKGYSSAVVVDGIIYVTGMDDQNQGYLFAFNFDGSLKWKTPYGPELGKSGPAVAGTRGSASVSGDRIFVMSGFGKLYFFERENGRLFKTIDLLEQSGAGQAKFGFAECVLVDGKKVICTPGGPDATLMAIDKETGDKIWQTKGLSQQSAYCSARFINRGERRLVVTLVEKGIVAVDPDNGKVLWQHEQPNRFGVRSSPPLYADGMIYFCAGGGSGGMQLALAEDGMSVTPTWTDKTLDPQMHGVVLLDGCIYGTAQSGNKGLVCLDWKTGKALWNAPEVKMGVVVSADDMLYVYAGDGTMYLVKPNPNAFEPVSKFAVTEGTDEHWAHPTIANGRLYIRHGDALLAYDIKAGS
jgi:outer membrane protein assembly factor BamB